MSQTTTIMMTKENLELLRMLKIHTRQSYDNVISEILEKIGKEKIKTKGRQALEKVKWE
jgi:hypothetical protein